MLKGRLFSKLTHLLSECFRLQCDRQCTAYRYVFCLHDETSFILNRYSVDIRCQWSRHVGSRHTQLGQGVILGYVQDYFLAKRQDFLNSRLVVDLTVQTWEWCQSSHLTSGEKCRSTYLWTTFKKPKPHKYVFTFISVKNLVSFASC